jgi:DNA modification methylase
MGRQVAVRILQGDVRLKLAELPSDYFDCIVTSPPYYGLRDYGTATWEGGDPACDHVVGEIRTGLGMEKLGERYAGGGHKQSEPKPLTAKNICPKCGARRIDQQIGLELTLDEYLETMVAVCRELRRVLKPTGIMFLNLGDSYCAGPPGKTSENAFKKSGLTGGMSTPGIARGSCQSRPTRLFAGLKPKDR